MPASATGKPRSTWNEWSSVQVHPGAGVVDRRGNTLLVVPVLRADQLEGARALIELCRRGQTGSPVPLDAVQALLDRHSPGEMPGFALLVRTGAALRVLSSGPVRVLVDGRAPAQAGADEGRRPAEHVLADDGWHEVTVTADGGPAAAETALPGLADALPLDLAGGTVPGAGVTLLAVPAVRAPEALGADAQAAAGPVTTLRPAVQFRTVLLGECVARIPGGRSARPPGRAPLPIAGAGSEGLADTAPRADVLVEGVLCAAGHFTDPGLPACPMCGSPRHPDDRTVTRPRPPLGILVTDGGTIYTVTGDVVIGREAASAPDVLAGSAFPLLLRDEVRSTSRVHARLTVRGWKVLLSDNASANGTFVSRHGAAGPWLPVPPQTPLPLVHGDRLRLGRRQLLYDTWREAVVPEVFR
ncbi:MAG: hypothetical protein QOJ68_2060 [Blastococcus sp.]|nr:hypothetical protein [Blastococcus sp.]